MNQEGKKNFVTYSTYVQRTRFSGAEKYAPKYQLSIFPLSGLRTLFDGPCFVASVTYCHSQFRTIAPQPLFPFSTSQSRTTIMCFGLPPVPSALVAAPSIPRGGVNSPAACSGSDPKRSGKRHADDQDARSLALAPDPIRYAPQTNHTSTPRVAGNRTDSRTRRTLGS